MTDARLHCQMTISFPDNPRLKAISVPLTEQGFNMTGDNILIGDPLEHYIIKCKFERINEYFKSIPYRGVDIKFSGMYKKGDSYLPCNVIVRWTARLEGEVND